MLHCVLRLIIGPAGDPIRRPAAAAIRPWRAAPRMLAAATAFLLAHGILAQDAPGRPDKSRFNLFHPTPRDLMRSLETDRPDQTESPITVDAGHFQVEADLFSYLEAEDDNLRQQEIVAPLLNLKVGLLNRMDLQVVLQPYSRVRVEDRSATPASTSATSGFGDMQVRTKVNLWGNDGGHTALAVMPFVQLPTGAPGLTTDAVEGGVIFPFAFDLPAGFAAGMMWEVDWIRSSASRTYHSEFVQSLTINRDLTQRFSAYVEFYSAVSTERGSGWLGMFDFGFNYLVNKNLKLDAGLNLGVTASAPDWNPFIGVTWRY